MCCSKRRQQRLLQQQQDLLIGGVQYQPRQRGCCGSRRRNHNLINYSAIAPSTEITQIQQPQYFCAGRPQRQTMAGILIVSLGIGAEKLGRKISEKRLERKERKASEVCTYPRYNVDKANTV